MAEIAIESATQGHTMRDDEDCCAAAHAMDKDLSTPASTHTDNGARWLKLKFGNTQFVHKIVIYSRFFTNWFRPNNDCVKDETNFKGCVENDNNVDVSVYQGDVKQKSCGTLQLNYGLEQSDQIYTLFCNIIGDSVKLTKNTGAITVFEVVVIGTGKLKLES